MTNTEDIINISSADYYENDVFFCGEIAITTEDIVMFKEELYSVINKYRI